MQMKLQILVSAMHKGSRELIEQMHLDSDAIVISQGEEYSYEEYEYNENRMRYFGMKERGVGLSRNNALLRADQDIMLFADEDIVYEEGYEKKVLQAFLEHPEADMLLFNVQQAPDRQTYHIDSFGRVRWYNCGRYPSYSFAVKREKIHKNNITFSLLFGGGAKYSNGEDSLFIRDCLKCGLKVYKVPVNIGAEQEGESTWFKGYHEKFFFDRGVLYTHLYGRLSRVMAVRFLLKNKGNMCREIPVKQAYQIMCKGMKEGRA